MFKKFYLSDIVKNDDEIKEGLRDLLITLDKEHSPFQIDVYLYIDSEGIGSLDTFVNVGGNSWRNDKHYVLTSVNYEYDYKTDTFEVEDIAEILGKTLSELRTETANWLSCNIDPDNEDEYDGEIYSFVGNNTEYREKIEEAYNEFCCEKEYNTDIIIDKFCDEYLEKMIYIYENDEDRNIFDDILEIAPSSDEFHLDQFCGIACMLNKYDRFTYDSERYGNEICVQAIKFFKDDKVVNSLKVGVDNESD